MIYDNYKLKKIMKTKLFAIISPFLFLISSISAYVQTNHTFGSSATISVLKSSKASYITLWVYLFIFPLLFIGLRANSQSCLHKLIVHDHGSDGWNGGYLTVTLDGTTPIFYGTQGSGGGPTTYYFYATSGQSLDVNLDPLGTKPTEIGFEVQDYLGNVLTPLSGPSTNFHPYTDGTWQCSGCASCPCYPTTQATSFTSSSIASTTMTVGWTRGGGNNVLVIAKAGSAPTDPTNGTTYTANAAYGSGTSVGGGYAVYNGTGTSVNLTALTAGTTYYFAIYEYATTGTCYNLTELTGNATTCISPATSIATPGTICAGQSSALSLSGSGTAYQWQSSTSLNGTYSNISGATSSTYNTTALTSTSYYRCMVTNGSSSKNLRESINFNQM